MKIELILGNCIEKLKQIPSNSCSLAVTSPPYNMNLRVRNGKHCSRQIVKEITTKYKSYDDNLPMEEYFKMNKAVIEELLRISELVFYNVQFLTGNKSALFKLIGFFSENIKEFIIWDKINSQPAIGYGVMNSRFEVLIVFSKKQKAITRQFENSNFNRGTLENLWEIKRGKKIDKSHGAVFPIELAEKIIKNFSKEGDTVIDPFMGTGTTGVACKTLKRNFIGVELDESYLKIAQKRILW